MGATSLADCYTAPAPFVSVYVAAPSDVVGADDLLRQRWRDLRHDAVVAGAPTTLLDDVGRALEEAGHADGDTLAVVAAGDGVRIATHLPEPPRRDLVRVDSLPYLAPLIELEQLSVPHVVVLADREGADLVAFAEHRAVRTATVSGDTEHIHRGAPGGWSQRRFQQRAENTWDRNAKGVAAEVVGVCESVEAELLVVAGDVRAVGFLREHLPKRWLDRLHVADVGARGDDAAAGALASEVVRLVASRTAADTVALLEELAERRGRGDRAVDGIPATFDALARAQVDTLLVHDDPDDDRRAWFGPQGADVATDPARLRALGVAGREGRLVDVALRAAYGTGARVRIVPRSGPHAPAEGLGGLLRSPTPAG